MSVDLRAYDDFLQGKGLTPIDKSAGAPPSIGGAATADPEEIKFREWYKSWAKIAEIDPNPDNPLHKYDYRAAFKAGVEPEFNTGDAQYHWPSEFKAPDHPSRYVEGVDTITGQSAYQSKPGMEEFDSFLQAKGLRPIVAPRVEPERLTEFDSWLRGKGYQPMNELPERPAPSLERPGPPLPPEMAAARAQAPYIGPAPLTTRGLVGYEETALPPLEQPPAEWAPKAGLAKVGQDAKTYFYAFSDAMMRGLTLGNFDFNNLGKRTRELFEQREFVPKGKAMEFMQTWGSMLGGVAPIAAAFAVGGPVGAAATRIPMGQAAIRAAVAGTLTGMARKPTEDNIANRLKQIPADVLLYGAFETALLTEQQLYAIARYNKQFGKGYKPGVYGEYFERPTGPTGGAATEPFDFSAREMKDIYNKSAANAQDAAQGRPGSMPFTPKEKAILDQLVSNPRGWRQFFTRGAKGEFEVSGSQAQEWGWQFKPETIARKPRWSDIFRDPNLIPGVEPLTAEQRAMPAEKVMGREEGVPGGVRVKTITPGSEGHPPGAPPQPPPGVQPPPAGAPRGLGAPPKIKVTPTPDGGWEYEVVPPPAAAPTPEVITPKGEPHEATRGGAISKEPGPGPGAGPRPLQNALTSGRPLDVRFGEKLDEVFEGPRESAKVRGDSAHVESTRNFLGKEHAEFSGPVKTVVDAAIANHPGLVHGTKIIVYTERKHLGDKAPFFPEKLADQSDAVTLEDGTIVLNPATLHKNNPDGVLPRGTLAHEMVHSQLKTIRRDSSPEFEGVHKEALAASDNYVRHLEELPSKPEAESKDALGYELMQDFANIRDAFPPDMAYKSTEPQETVTLKDGTIVPKAGKLLQKQAQEDIFDQLLAMPRTKLRNTQRNDLISSINESGGGSAGEEISRSRKIYLILSFLNNLSEKMGLAVPPWPYDELVAYYVGQNPAVLEKLLANTAKKVAPTGEQPAARPGKPAPPTKETAPPPTTKGAPKEIPPAPEVEPTPPTKTTPGVPPEPVQPKAEKPTGPWKIYTKIHGTRDADIMTAIAAEPGVTVKTVKVDRTGHRTLEISGPAKSNVLAVGKRIQRNYGKRIRPVRPDPTDETANAKANIFGRLRGNFMITDKNPKPPAKIKPRVSVWKDDLYGFIKSVGGIRPGGAFGKAEFKDLNLPPGIVRKGGSSAEDIYSQALEEGLIHEHKFGDARDLYEELQARKLARGRPAVDQEEPLPDDYEAYAQQTLRRLTRFTEKDLEGEGYEPDIRTFTKGDKIFRLAVRNKKTGRVFIDPGGSMMHVEVYGKAAAGRTGQWTEFGRITEAGYADQDGEWWDSKRILDYAKDLEDPKTKIIARSARQFELGFKEEGEKPKEVAAPAEKPGVEEVKEEAPLQRSEITAKAVPPIKLEAEDELLKFPTNEEIGEFEKAKDEIFNEPAEEGPARIARPEEISVYKTEEGPISAPVEERPEGPPLYLPNEELMDYVVKTLDDMRPQFARLYNKDYYNDRFLDLVDAFQGKNVAKMENYARKMLSRRGLERMSKIVDLTTGRVTGYKPREPQTTQEFEQGRPKSFFPTKEEPMFQGAEVGPEERLQTEAIEKATQAALDKTLDDFRYIAGDDERNFEILKETFINGLSLREVGEKLRISQEAVRKRLEPMRASGMIAQSAAYKRYLETKIQLNRVMDRQLRYYHAGIPAPTSRIEWMEIWENLKRLFLSGRGLPKDIEMAADRRVNEFMAHKVMATAEARALNNWIVRENQNNPSVRAYALDALTGEQDFMHSYLPEKIKDLLVRMRGQIDGLSQQIMANVVPNTPAERLLINSIDRNIGYYLGRFYKLHEYNLKYARRKWLRRYYHPTPEVREAFKRRLLADHPRIFGGLSNKDMEDYLDSIIRGKPFQYQFQSGARRKSIPTQHFIRRKQLPQEWRDFLGEIEDPVYLYIRTVVDMASMVYNAKFLNLVYSGYEGKLWSRTEVPAWKNYTLDDNLRWGKMRGAYIHPALYEFLKYELVPMVDATTRAIEQFIINPFKLSKTVLSIPTNARNFLGNPFFAILSRDSLFNPTNLPFYIRAFKTFWNRNKILPPERTRSGGVRLRGADEWKRLVEPGATETQYYGAELPQVYEKLMRLDPAGWWDRLAVIPNWTLNKMGSAYNFEDALYRISSFYKNEEHFGMTPAENVREINLSLPNYRKLPAAVDWLRKWPLLGPFVSFSWNVGKIMTNQVVEGISQVRAGAGYGEPRVRPGRYRAAQSGRVPSEEADAGYDRVKDRGMFWDGMKRLWRVAAAASLPFILKEVVERYYEIDQEKMAKIEKFYPDFLRNGIFVYWRDSRNRIRQVDLSNIWPTGQLGEVIKAINKGDVSALAKVLNVAQSPIFDLIMIAKGLDPASLNELPPGAWSRIGLAIQRIWMPQSMPIPSGGTIEQLIKTGKFEPRAGILTTNQIKRLIDAYWQEGLSGTSLPEEVRAFLTGVRSYVVDPEQVLGMASRSIDKQYEDLKSASNKWSYRNQKSPEWERSKKLHEVQDRLSVLNKKKREINDLIKYFRGDENAGR